MFNGVVEQECPDNTISDHIFNEKTFLVVEPKPKQLDSEAQKEN